MGIAAYNRGTQVLRARIASEQRDTVFVFMEELNNLPKHPEASAPFGTIHFVHSHGGVFAECPKTGFGYWYKNLRTAVSAWKVTVTECKNGVFVAQPNNVRGTT